MLEDVLTKVNTKPCYETVSSLYNCVLDIEREGERRVYWDESIPAQVVESLTDRFAVYRTKFEGVGYYIQFHDTLTMQSYHFDLVNKKVCRFEMQDADLQYKICKFS